MPIFTVTMLSNSYYSFFLSIRFLYVYVIFDNKNYQIIKKKLILCASMGKELFHSDLSDERIVCIFFDMLSIFALFTIN